MKQIDDAIQQWALENKKSGTNLVSLTDPELLQFLRGSRLPVCPANGVYEVKTVADSPICSVHGTIENAQTWDRMRRRKGYLEKTLITVILAGIFLVVAGLRRWRLGSGQSSLLPVMPWLFFLPGFAVTFGDLYPPGYEWSTPYHFNGMIFATAGIGLCALVPISTRLLVRLSTLLILSVYLLVFFGAMIR